LILLRLTVAKPQTGCRLMISKIKILKNRKSLISNFQSRCRYLPNNTRSITKMEQQQQQAVDEDINMTETKQA